jgi:hypothetical protein
MSFVPTKLYCDSYFPNTETSLTMGNGHTQFAGLSDMTYSWVVDTSNNLVLNGQASGPSPAIQPIVIAPNGNVSIPSLDVSGSGVLSVSSSNGSGIKCTGTTNVNITANLIAGSGIVLTPDISDTAIVISCDVSGGDQWNTVPATTNVNMNANCLTNASNLTIGAGNTTVGPFAITLSSDYSNAQIYMGKSNLPTDTGNGGVLSVGSGYQLVYTSQGTSHEFVSSVSAGTGISITGSSSAPIINATGGGGIPDNLNISNLDVSGNISVDGYITNPTSGTVLINDSVQANKYDFPPVASPSAPATLNWAQITLPANAGGNISSSTLQYNFLRDTSMIFCTYNSTATVSSPPAVPLYVQQINVSAGTFVITGQSSATVAYAIFN